MNKFISTLLLIAATAIVSTSEASTDREAVVDAIKCFIKWDREGGTAETVSACMVPDVVYQRVNDKGELIRYTPGLDYEGKGIDDYVPYISELELYGNLAIVKTIKHRSDPGRPYMKAFLLYRLDQGWRITNVVWGGITPQK